MMLWNMPSSTTHLICWTNKSGELHNIILLHIVLFPVTHSLHPISLQSTIWADCNGYLGKCKWCGIYFLWPFLPFAHLICSFVCVSCWLVWALSWSPGCVPCFQHAELIWLAQLAHACCSLAHSPLSSVSIDLASWMRVTGVFPGSIPFLRWASICPYFIFAFCSGFAHSICSFALHQAIRWSVGLIWPWIACQWCHSHSFPYTGE